MLTFSTRNKVSGFGKGVEVDFTLSFNKTDLGVEFKPWKNQHGFGAAFSLSCFFFYIDVDFFIDLKD